MDRLDVLIEARDIEERHALLGDDVAAATPRWHLLLLLGLTLVGAGLRFFRIDHPTLWIDEGFTYWRVSGSYAARAPSRLAVPNSARSAC